MKEIKIQLSKRVYKKLYEVEVTDLKAGDILTVMASGQATNDTGWNVMLGRFITFNDKEVCESASSNITPDMHHGAIDKYWMFPVDRDYATAKVALVIYAASTRAHGMKLRIDQGRSGIAVRVN